MQYYEVGIIYQEEYEDAKGNLKYKRKSEKFLVKESSISKAEEKLKEKVKNVYNDYTIKYVKESPIMSVFE